MQHNLVERARFAPLSHAHMDLAEAPLKGVVQLAGCVHEAALAPFAIAGGAQHDEHLRRPTTLSGNTSNS